MAKALLITILILIVLAIGWMWFSFTPGEGERANISDSITGNTIADISNSDETKKAIDKSKSSLEFEGFSVGKSHDGTFDTWQGNLILEDNKLTGIEGTIQTNSVNTGTSGLDDHLKADDFFDVEKFPEIKFTSRTIDLNTKKMSGQLTFRGINKIITVPIQSTSNSISTEFFLDTTPFNMLNTGVNKEVRIAFEFII